MNLTNIDNQVADDSVAEPRQSSENNSNSYSNSGSSGHMMSSGCGGSNRGSQTDGNHCIVINRDCMEGDYFQHLQNDISIKESQHEGALLKNNKVTKDEQSKLVAS